MTQGRGRPGASHRLAETRVAHQSSMGVSGEFQVLALVKSRENFRGVWDLQSIRTWKILMMNRMRVDTLLLVLYVI